MRIVGIFLLLIVFSTYAFAQSSAIDAYLAYSNDDIEQLVQQVPAARTIPQLQNFFPHRLPGRFVIYMKAKSYPALLNALDAARLNKMVAGALGGSGSTALVSDVSVPAVLGFGIEHGSILQQQNGTVTSLRANLLGLAEIVAAAKQFPYCAELEVQHNPASCQPVSRHLRRFSVSLSFDDVRNTTTSATTAANNAAPTPVQLFGNDFRMAAWGVRADLASKQNLDDPAYLKAWDDEISHLTGNQFARDLTQAIDTFFARDPRHAAYLQWMNETVPLLRMARDVREFKKQLEARLDLLGPMLSAADPDFAKSFNALSGAYSNYYTVRDELVRNAQRHKFAAEYVNLHPQNQPNRSTIRLIYSHQPTNAPTVVTANFALDYYNARPTGVPTNRLRDLQIAGQLSQRLGTLTNLGQVVLTVGGYYQWMRDDAIITIGQGNSAPGSGIVLPNAAAKLLGTKGHIGIAQTKLSLPITDTIKIPISLTWATRTELINEQQVRGQVGLTLDLDKAFR